MIPRKNDFQRLANQFAEISDFDFAQYLSGMAQEAGTLRELSRTLCLRMAQVFNEAATQADPIITEQLYGVCLSDGTNLFKRLRDAINTFAAGGRKINAQSSTIDERHVQKSLYNACLTKFDDIRDSITSDIRMLELHLRTAKYEEVMNRVGMSHIDKLTQEAENNAENLRRLLDSAKDRVIDRDVKLAKAEFAGRQTTHRIAATLWFIALVVSGYWVASMIIYYIVDPNLGSINTDLRISISRFIVLSASAALVRICLTKFNAERNLQILYAHRVAALTHYERFQGAIGEDREQKNALRLEFARYLFSDPRTGYEPPSKGGQINIAPTTKLTGDVG